MNTFKNKALMALETRRLYSFSFLGCWNSPLTASFLHLRMHREVQILTFY